MKAVMAILTLVFTFAVAQAEEPTLSHVPVGTDTTITIQKGNVADRDCDMVNGNAEITGDSNVLLKGARESWKKACNDWKAEIKDLNKNNSVVALNCNSPKCTTESNGTVCTSQANYQVCVKVRK